MRYSLAFIALLLPSFALAESTTTNVISQIAGLFYLVVGLALTAAILLMLAGFIVWLARLGTHPTYRDNAIALMEWGVATLFTLVLVLGVVEFVQTHSQATLYILGLVVICLVIWIVITSGLLSDLGGGKKEEKEEE